MLSSLSEFQGNLVKYLKQIESTIGAPFLAADPYSAEIVFWFVGDRERLLKALSQSDFIAQFRFSTGRRSERRQGQRIGHFGDSDIEAMSSVAVHRRLNLGKTAIYGSLSGVKIMFPAVDPLSESLKVSEYCFTQMELQKQDIGNYPLVHVLGEPFLALPNLARLIEADTIPQKVDLVYTWVDGTDPGWLQKKAETLGETSSSPNTRDGDAVSRFVGRNELLYSLRSAWMYFRNLGKIYVVTAGQRPSFLDPVSDIVQVIDHRDIFPSKDDLPTFNSHAIEANLHRIPGLSEKYLYLNDDVLFCRPVTAKLFFDEYDRSLYFPSRSVAIPSGAANAVDLASDAAAKNARDLVSEKFNVYVTRKFKHTPIALIKGVVEEMESCWPDIFRKVSGAKIRSFHDFAVSGSLYFHYATCVGKASASEIVYNFFDINGDQFTRLISEYLYVEADTKRLDTVCINDHGVTAKTGSNEQFFLRLMGEVYPEAAPFEIGQ